MVLLKGPDACKHIEGLTSRETTYEIGPNGREILDHRDTVFFQMLRRTDATTHIISAVFLRS